MSLLMDALKRAEESKQDAARAITRGGRPGEGELTLEPATGESPAGLPDLADHIDALDADLAASAPAAGPQRPAGPGAAPAAPLPDPNRERVRNAFGAKLPPPRESHRGLWLAVAAGVVGAAALAGYFYYQFATLNQHSLARPSPPPMPAIAAAPAPSAPPFVPPPPAGAALERLAMPPTESLRPAPEAAPAPAAPVAPEAPTAAIRLKRTPPATDPNVARGYAALQGNGLDAARLEYEQALRNDPRNVDALLALAAIAQRQGRPAEAEQFQQRAYEADPRDAAAQAAVIGSAGADPALVESRLRSLLAAQPEAPALNFALGNHLARQQRWPEAQQAYFNAVAAEGDNPDYLFNLAVSLDHLRQPRLAAQHYRLALEAAEKRPAAFDRERAKKRLQDLQP